MISINDTDLRDLGIFVSEIVGFQNIPKRKKPYENIYAGKDGSEPFLDAQDIFVEPRDFKIKGALIASNISTAETNFGLLQDLLKGGVRLQIDYLGRVFFTYLKNGMKANRFGSIHNPTFDLEISLSEVNPLNKITFTELASFDSEQIVDFENNIIIGYE
jgi:hypothetical protein